MSSGAEDALHISRRRCTGKFSDFDRVSSRSWLLTGLPGPDIFGPSFGKMFPGTNNPALLRQGDDTG